MSLSLLEQIGVLSINATSSSIQPNQVWWSQYASIEGYSRFWSDSSAIETFVCTIAIPKDVVDRIALGTIAEQVSCSTSSRS
jgi:hypothetical protein